MSCPQQKNWMSCADYQRLHPGCPCSPTNPAPARPIQIPLVITNGGSGSRREALLQLLLDYYGEQPIDDATLDQLLANLENLDVLAEDSPSDYFPAVSDLFGKYGLSIPQIDTAFSAAQLSPNTVAGIEFERRAADLMRENGMHLSAIATYKSIQTQIVNPDAHGAAIIATAVQGQARAFELLGQKDNADNLFVIANHMMFMAGKMP